MAPGPRAGHALSWAPGWSLAARTEGWGWLFGDFLLPGWQPTAPAPCGRLALWAGVIPGLGRRGDRRAVGWTNCAESRWRCAGAAGRRHVHALPGVSARPWTRGPAAPQAGGAHASERVPLQSRRMETRDRDQAGLDSRILIPRTSWACGHCGGERQDWPRPRRD